MREQINWFTPFSVISSTQKVFLKKVLLFHDELYLKAHIFAKVIYCTSKKYKTFSLNQMKKDSSQVTYGKLSWNHLSSLNSWLCAILITIVLVQKRSISTLPVSFELYLLFYIKYRKIIGFFVIFTQSDRRDCFFLWKFELFVMLTKAFCTKSHLCRILVKLFKKWDEVTILFFIFWDFYL